MSVEAKAVALAEAVRHHSTSPETSPATIVTTAKAFAEFLLGPAAAAAKASAAGSEPAPKAENKPSATTAGAAKKPAATAAKPPKKTEEQLAAEALEKAEPAGEPEELTEALEATKEGVSAAVAAMIAKGKAGRDHAIGLLKKYKAASVTSMQAKGDEVIAEFIGEVNTYLGLGEPTLE